MFVGVFFWGPPGSMFTLLGGSSFLCVPLGSAEKYAQILLHI